MRKKVNCLKVSAVLCEVFPNGSISLKTIGGIMREKGNQRFIHSGRQNYPVVSRISPDLSESVVLGPTLRKRRFR